MATYEKPVPKLNKLNRPYFEAAKRGEFRLQRCNACGHQWYPASSHCPQCLSKDYQWAKMSGRGKVWSYIVMHQKYFKSFEKDLPYNVAFIQLDEGPLMMSTVVGVPNSALRCDMPVEVVIEEATEEIAVPKFRPVQ
jgi:uncharacterized OB-fold protein